MTADKEREPAFTRDHVIFGLAGAGIGWLAGYLSRSSSQKSRAEREQPDEVNRLLTELDELLSEWEAPDFGEDEGCEDDFRDDLADFLRVNLRKRHGVRRHVEVAPQTREGKPDILIDALVALEVKCRHSKSERDRCVGQSAGYSRQWATLIILIDASASEEADLKQLLDDKGLTLPIISFGRPGQDDDEDDDDDDDDEDDDDDDDDDDEDEDD